MPNLFPMNRRAVVTVTLLVLGVATPVMAFDFNDCSEGTNPDLNVRACTSIIESGNENSDNLVVAYFHRGNAYQPGDEVGF